MRKFFIICVLSILVIFTLNFTVNSKNYNYVDLNNGQEGIQKSIASKIIRFHVIANSDLKSDQALKLKVRDAVLGYISPKLKNSRDINESRKILKENDKNILNVARKIIYEEGYNYKVTSTLGQADFPIKTYGNITLPQGRYEAYRIIIGEGKGQNWWCVMFPPLCFVDISKGQISYDSTEKEMKSVLNEKEYNSVDNGIEHSNTHEASKKIKIRFKIVDFIKKIGF
ncbi:stage II sporulation protein R [Clostridium sp. LBM24168]